ECGASHWRRGTISVTLPSSPPHRHITAHDVIRSVTTHVPRKQRRGRDRTLVQQCKTLLHKDKRWCRDAGYHLQIDEYRIILSLGCGGINPPETAATLNGIQSRNVSTILLTKHADSTFVSE